MPLLHGTYAVSGKAQAAAAYNSQTCFVLAAVDSGATAPASKAFTSFAALKADALPNDAQKAAAAVAFAAGVPEVICANGDDATDLGAALKGIYGGLHKKPNLVVLLDPANSLANAAAIAGSCQNVIGSQSYDAMTYADMAWDAGWTAADSATAAAIATAARAATLHPKNLALHCGKITATADGVDTVFGPALFHAIQQVAVDAQNADIPFEGASNFEPPGPVKSVQTAFSRDDGNTCNEAGVNVVIYDEGYRLWGDYLSSYDFAGTTDADGIFIQHQRMIQYLRQGFLAMWKNVIDRGFTRQLRDTILATEQAKLDRLAARGALIGSPEIEFLPADNPQSEVIQGHFFWRMEISPALPLVSAKLSVAYTDSGYAVLFE